MGARNSCETLETKLDFSSLSCRCCRNARQAVSNPIKAASGRDGNERAEPERTGTLQLIELVRAGEINIHYQELFRPDRGGQDVGGQLVQWHSDFPATALAAGAVTKSPHMEIRR